MKSKLSFLVGLVGLVFALSVGAETVTVKDLGTDRIPLDPNYFRIWNTAPKTNLDLEKQAVTEPNGGGATKKVQVQAVHNDTFIAILLQWTDGTQNTEALNKFSDAAAVQFPTNGTDAGSPFMGDETNTVNIWQWRADWQKDIQTGYQDVNSANPDMFTTYVANDAVDFVARQVGNPGANQVKRSSVADLLANGFGTLTYDPHQDVSGLGEYKDGVWRVILLRSLATTDEGNAQFKKGGKSFAAFAIWDGDSEERNGMKSVTMNWVELSLE